jgi:TRAP-type mannitol/chloroaromatic compound transport system permease small subunit
MRPRAAGPRIASARWRDYRSGKPLPATERNSLNALLRLAAAIDAANDRLGTVANGMVLAACVISAANAMMRYAFDLSSNAWLEVQWYLFAGVVMLGASQTLRLNEHVRVDIVYMHLSERGREWLDLVGTAVFLVPTMLVIAWFSWPFFLQSWSIQETSTNAGGLIRWPVKLLLPAGFVLVALQGVSEIIKRAAALRGDVSFESRYERPLQ